MENKPWLNEPDRLLWSDRGFHCLIVRHTRKGHLSGYIGIDKGHPCYKVSYDKIQQQWKIITHGELTYSSFSQGVIALFPNKKDRFWWVGFDCSWSTDYCPYESDNWPDAKYRDIEYVQEKVTLLAIQLKLAVFESMI